MRLRRALNNNAAVVTAEDGTSAVVLGKAIAYGKRTGDSIDPSLVSEVFVADASRSIDQLAAHLSDISIDVVRVAREIVTTARERTGIRVTQSVILPIADHLAYAIQRTAEGLVLEYPLKWEVRQLYPDELAVGQLGVELVRKRLGVQLAADEAVPIALHLVNAQFTTAGLNRTVKMTEKITQVVEVVRQASGLDLDIDSMSVARFITHLRYLFVRLQENKQIQDSPQALLGAIFESHEPAVGIAGRVRVLLEMGGSHLTKDEVAYLTLHIARLLADGRAH